MFIPSFIKAGSFRNQKNRRLSRAAGLALLLMAAPGGLSAADNYQWDAIDESLWQSGNWTTPGNWSPATVPPNDGTAAIRFDLSGGTGNLITGIGSNGTTWEIDSLYYKGTANTNEQLYIYAGELDGTSARTQQSNTLRIGAGGITLEGGNASGGGSVLFLGNVNVSENRVHVELTTDQTWSISRHSSNGEMNNHGTLRLAGDLLGSGNLFKTGNGYLRFESGESTSYTGTVTLDNGGIILNSYHQLDRLGSQPLLWHNTASTTLGFSNDRSTLQTYSQAITFSDTGSGLYNLSLMHASETQKLQMTGELQGTLNESIVFLGAGGDHRSSYLALAADNSDLTSTRAGGNQNSGSTYLSALYIRRGNIVLDHANALGLNNSLSVSLGDANGNRIGSRSSLVATDGNDVSSKIYTSLNDRAAGSATGTAVVGLAGTGAVTFSGEIHLGVTNSEAVNYHNLHFFAETEGVATFSGKITQNAETALYKPTVFASGGGTVILSSEENDYGGTGTAAGYGGTSIIEGTTLVANGGRALAEGSATGTGSLRIGLDATTVTGVNTTNGSGFITTTNPGSLKVGQQVSGTGIAAGSVVERIFADGTIQLSKNATATGTATLTGAASAGTLSGTGRIRPGEGNAIFAASTGVIAPGNPLDTAVGTLVLDGGGTSAPLVMLEEGASFEFRINGNTADRIDFWNYSAGDLAPSDHVVNLTLSGSLAVGEQQVDLFRFYSDEGDTLGSSGPMGGFTLQYDPELFSSASLSYTGGSVLLTYTTTAMIPEPGTWALLGLSTALLALHRRRAARRS